MIQFSRVRQNTNWFVFRFPNNCGIYTLWDSLQLHKMTKLYWFPTKIDSRKLFEKYIAICSTMVFCYINLSRTYVMKNIADLIDQMAIGIILNGWFLLLLLVMVVVNYSCLQSWFVGWFQSFVQFIVRSLQIKQVA